jgi:enamine deaminase RidA (YjgF/YER057c/UK114 family)
VTGEVAFVDGLLPLVPGDFAAQARQAMDALRAELEAVGSSLASVVAVTAYLTDADRAAELAPLLADFAGGSLLAVAVLQVARLSEPGMLLELGAVAVVPSTAAAG